MPRNRLLQPGQVDAPIDHALADRADAKHPAGVHGNFADLADKTSRYRLAKLKGQAARAFFGCGGGKESRSGGGSLAPKTKV